LELRLKLILEEIVVLHWTQLRDRIKDRIMRAFPESDGRGITLILCNIRLFSW
jgi:hypothetical protein